MRFSIVKSGDWFWRYNVVRDGHTVITVCVTLAGARRVVKRYLRAAAAHWHEDYSVGPKP